VAHDDHRHDKSADLTRRSLLKATGLAMAGAALYAGARTPETPAATAREAGTDNPGTGKPYSFLREDEAVFITAATARLIPGDARSPGAREADVSRFIDQALAGPWGHGDRMYTSGPWHEGTPQQGYQLKFTPAELYRTALTAILRDREQLGAPFAQLSEADQDAYLRKLETGKLDLGGVPSDVFFDMLLQNAIEGYLSDPIYGGNRNMVGWKAIAFPGAFAAWYDLADKHGINLDERAANPISIADAAVHGRHSRMKSR
jgi:gluconate 2-dehydrogenase gamma chain